MKKIQLDIEAFLNAYAKIRRGIETKFTNMILVVPSVTQQEGNTECGLVVIQWMFAIMLLRKHPFSKNDFDTSLIARVSNNEDFNFNTAKMTLFRKQIKKQFILLQHLAENQSAARASTINRIASLTCTSTINRVASSTSVVTKPTSTTTIASTTAASTANEPAKPTSTASSTLCFAKKTKLTVPSSKTLQSMGLSSDRRRLRGMPSLQELCVEATEVILQLPMPKELG
mgnify:CR=1 FL=1